MQRKKKVYFWNSNDPRCISGSSGVQHRLPTCPVRLRPPEPYEDENSNGQYDPGEPFSDMRTTRNGDSNGVYDDVVPVEPLVIRAAAGECVEVTLRNKMLSQAKDADGHYVCYSSLDLAFEDRGGSYLPYYADKDGDGICEAPAVEPITWDTMPDLPNRNPLQLTIVRERNLGTDKGVTWFGNNHVRPSAQVGMHPALVEYDVTRADGVVVGDNGIDAAVVPGGHKTYKWYAGHLEMGSPSNGKINLVATPIEFGGFNISPADKIKQHQKGMVAAGVVYPEGSTWTVDEGTYAAATVTTGNESFRDFTTVWQKNLNFYWADGDSVFNTEAEAEGVTEDPEDAGHMAINYGTEPAWFRFGVPPCNEGACENIADAHRYYANELVGGDPETPVFTAYAGEPFRMHVLMPASSARKSVPTLHGHVWQRDPYVCPDSAHAGLAGKCTTDDVGSQALGENPVGFYIGAFQSLMASGHFEIVAPSAGGAYGVTGDYLFRDHMGLGNLDGLWGILRVVEAAAASPPDEEPGPKPKPCKGKKCK
jgi:hypothetical protein